MAANGRRSRPINIRIRAQAGVLSVLELSGSGVLPRLNDVRRALFELRIQVVRHEADRERLIERLHLVEFDGARIAPQRRAEMLAVLTKRLGRPGLAKTSLYEEHVRVEFDPSPLS